MAIESGCGRSGRALFPEVATAPFPSMLPAMATDVQLSDNQQNHFFKEDPWRIFRIMAEFVESFEVMSRIGPAVSVFGSARMKRSDPYYQAAVELARQLAHHGFAVITGGGPGIMEAANKGAALARGRSVGLNIELPREQKGNRYANVPLHFHYFFARKVCFVKYSCGFVFMPGGFGTLDEFAEISTLVQTERIPRFPLILFGRPFWRGLLDWMRRQMLGRQFISPEDLDLFLVTDSVEEAVEAILAYREEKGVPRRAPKAFA